MHIQTSQKAELFMHTLRMTILGVFAVFISAFVLTLTFTTQTEAATSSDINFQARLENATGSIAADGTYNVEFKLYNASSSSGSSQGSCTGDTNCLWTEDYLVSAGHSAQVVNGYLTVNLGSITAFPTNMNWNQQLWLTMRIGGTGSSPTWDTEMSPRLLMTGTAYSFQAGQLSYTNSTYVGTLSFASTLTGTDAITIPDTAGAGGTVCLQSSASCGFAASSGSGSYIQNGITSQTANFYIQSSLSTDIGAIIKGASSQSVDLLELQNSTGTPLAKFDNNGDLTIATSTTNSGLTITQSGNPTSTKALILANNTNGTPSGNLLDL